ncbi:hypothetical protein PENTCL1PPCAC_5770, partial [Pristionchus entomophagus]
HVFEQRGSFLAKVPDTKIYFFSSEAKKLSILTDFRAHLFYFSFACALMSKFGFYARKYGRNSYTHKVLRFRLFD